MDRKTFSKAVVERLEMEAGNRYTDYGDNECRYLRLRVGKEAKVWYYVRKIDGKVKWLRLGDWPGMSVEAARKKHDVISGQVAQGETPVVKQVPTVGVTFGQMYQEYMDEHMKVKRDSWKDDEGRWRKYLSAWATMGEISPNMVAALHAEIGKTAKVQANRVIEQISRIFNYRKKKMQSELRNPADGITKFKEKSRKRFLRATELKAFFDAIAVERTAWENAQEVVDVNDMPEDSPDHLPANPDHLDYLEVLLWTGQRPRVVQSMTWDEVDLKGGFWRLPVGRTKTEEEQVVILGPAHEILGRRALARKEGVDWVFPAARGKGHMRDPKKSFFKVLKRSGLVDVQMYDLRRTLGSWLVGSGGNVREVMGILGHTTMAAAQVYMQLDVGPMERRHKAATDAMLRAIGDET